MSAIVDTQTAHNSKRIAENGLPSPFQSLDILIAKIYEHYREIKVTTSFEGKYGVGSNSYSDPYQAGQTSSTGNEKNKGFRISVDNLAHYNVADLKLVLSVFHERTQSASSILVMQLKRRDHLRGKMKKLCDKMSTMLQSVSTSYISSSKVKFSIEPPGDSSNFDVWKGALQCALRLPVGLPKEFRSRVWLALAKNGILHGPNIYNVNYEDILNEMLTNNIQDASQSDSKQFTGSHKAIVVTKEETCHDKSIDKSNQESGLARILRAYSHVNKEMSFKNCHFLRLIAKRIYVVMEDNEADTLRVLVYLLHHVMPADYFSRHLQGLAADLAVIRELLRQNYPKLWEHLNMLQSKASAQYRGDVVEPPLTNLFCTQWLLTLFDSILPHEIVFRLWDIMFLEGSEVLLCAAVAIWAVLSKYLLKLSSSEQFYSEMPNLLSRMRRGDLITHQQFMVLLHNIQGPTLLSHSLRELRERYTYNINPFLPLTSRSNSKDSANGRGRRASLPIQRASVRRLWSDPTGLHGSIILSDDEDNEDFDDTDMAGCLSGVFCGLSLPVHPRLLPPGEQDLDGATSLYSLQSHSFTRDISMLSPGAVSITTTDPSQNVDCDDRSSVSPNDRKGSLSASSAYTERMSTDLKALENKFKQVKWRQKHTSLYISTNVSGTLRAPASPPSKYSSSTSAKQEMVVNMLAPQCLQDVSTGGNSQTINHLFYHPCRSSSHHPSFQSHLAPITSTTSPQVRSITCASGRRTLSRSTSSYPTALSRKSSDAMSSYTFETSSYASSCTVGCYMPLGKKTCILQQVNSKSNDGLSPALFRALRQEASLLDPTEVRKELRSPIFRSDDSICSLLNGVTCRVEGENENMHESLEGGIVNSLSTATNTPISPCQLTSPDPNSFSFKQGSDQCSQVSQSSGIASIIKVHPHSESMHPLKDMTSVRRKIVKTHSATERWIEQTQQLLFQGGSGSDVEGMSGSRPWQNLHAFQPLNVMKSKESGLSNSVFVTNSAVVEDNTIDPVSSHSKLVKRKHHSVAQDTISSSVSTPSPTQLKLQPHQLFTHSRVQFGSQFGLYKSMKPQDNSSQLLTDSTVFTS